MHLEAMVERDRTSGQRSMDGVPGGETLFCIELMRNCGNVTRRLDLSSLMESWLEAGNVVERNGGG